MMGRFHLEREERELLLRVGGLFLRGPDKRFKIAPET